MFRGRDGAGHPVLIRTFAQTFSLEQRERFMAALEANHEASLEHPSIARQLASGLTPDGRPYVVHAYLPGTPIDAASRHGLDEGIKHLTHVAAGLDFAAAAGVVHGALSAADVIIAADSAGVSGLGLVQALEAAGVPGFHARREDDVAGLRDIARTLLGASMSPAVESLLSAPVPRSSLAFVAALHRTIDAEAATAPPAPALDAELPFRDDDFAPDPVVDYPTESEDSELIDFQLRHDEQTLAAAPTYGATGTPLAAQPRRGGLGSWLLIGTVALALGIMAGFAGGFSVGRDAPDRQTTAAPPAAEPAAPTPEPTNGQTFTDAPVDEPLQTPPAAPPPAAAVDQAAAQDSDRVPPAEPESATARPAPTPPPARATQPSLEPPAVRAGPAAMRVESNPAGAQVFVDGRSVGYTPLIVGDLTPGTHSIRMQLPGYRPWVSAVTLGPGARERVAASLEQ